MRVTIVSFNVIIGTIVIVFTVVFIIVIMFKLGWCYQIVLRLISSCCFVVILEDYSSSRVMVSGSFTLSSGLGGPSAWLDVDEVDGCWSIGSIG